MHAHIEYGKEALLGWLGKPIAERKRILIFACSFLVKRDSTLQRALFGQVIDTLKSVYPNELFFSTDGMKGAMEVDREYSSSETFKGTVGITYGFPTAEERTAVLVRQNCQFLVCIVAAMERNDVAYCIANEKIKEDTDLVFWGPEIAPLPEKSGELLIGTIVKKKEKKHKEEKKELVPVEICPPPAPIVIHEDGMDMYECCICTHIPSFPWQSCINGHLICAECYNDPRFGNRICPQCNVSLAILYKQRILEETVKKFNIPLLLRCRNKGCNLQIPLRDMDDHQKLCSHRAYVCPYKNIHAGSACVWKGPQSAMHEHLRWGHNALIMEESQLWIPTTTKPDDNVWVIPSLNLLTVCTVMNKGGLPHPGYRLHVGSLTSEAASLCVVLSNVRTAYMSRSIMRVPSLLSEEVTPFCSLLLQQKASSTIEIPLNMNDPVDEAFVHFRSIHPSKKRKDRDDLAVLLWDTNIDCEDPADDLLLTDQPPPLKRQRVEVVPPLPEVDDEKGNTDDPMLVDKDDEEETAPLMRDDEVEEEEDNPNGKE
jgi:hypothetical protein